MPDTIRLSDHCVLEDYEGDPFPPAELPLKWKLRFPFAAPLILLDSKMHFTGGRGMLWRLLGVRRSSKNPNVCNV